MAMSRKSALIVFVAVLASLLEIIDSSIVNVALPSLAHDFHTNYSAHQFIVEDAALRDARLTLAVAAQTVIRNGLELLGVSAPETM